MALLGLLIFLATILSNFHGTHQIHLIRPKSGSSDHHRVPGISCLSWRLGVETNNIVKWITVPQECERYVGNYVLGQQYRKDSKAVIGEALAYVKSLKLAGDGKDIWIFDIDETSLSNLPYFAQHGFGAKPYDPTLFSQWVAKGIAPALPESLYLYKNLLSLGIKIVFLTGRTQDKLSVTSTNLNHAGYRKWEKLILRTSSYSGKAAVLYKSSERAKLEKKGYRIIGNIGDQWSDLLGTNNGNRTFKLPDPMYYIN